MTLEFLFVVDLTDQKYLQASLFLKWSADIRNTISLVKPRVRVRTGPECFTAASERRVNTALPDGPPARNGVFATKSSIQQEVFLKAVYHNELPTRHVVST